MLTSLSVDSFDSKEYSKTKYRTRILLAAPFDLFSPHKVHPWRNCVRVRFDGDSIIRSRLKPTPLYNSTICSDSTLSNYIELLSSTSAKSSGFRDACLLLSIWLHQRGFSSSLCEGGLGYFEVSVIMALLLNSGGPEGNGPLPTGCTSYQLFRALLHFFATTDLVKVPVMVEFQNRPEESTLKPSLPIFFDGTCGLNLLFKMTLWSYKKA